MRLKKSFFVWSLGFGMVIVGIALLVWLVQIPFPKAPELDHISLTLPPVVPVSNRLTHFFETKLSLKNEKNAYDKLILEFNSF